MHFGHITLVFNVIFLHSRNEIPNKSANYFHDVRLPFVHQKCAMQRNYLVTPLQKLHKTFIRN